ncbi:MAG: hypothetical protein KDA87_03005 [Planctomycetales bacterium]|nr:hypothetical protein [Planctomycetales bacterium]
MIGKPGSTRIAVLLLCSVLVPSSLLFGQSTGAAYESIACQNRRPSELRPMLLDLLPKDGSVHLVADDGSGQILIKANAEDMRAARTAIIRLDRPLETNATAADSNLAFREPVRSAPLARPLSSLEANGSNPAVNRPATAATAARPLNNDSVSRFVALPSDAAAIEQRFQTLLGQRLNHVANEGIYLLTTAAGETIEFEFDYRRRGVLVTARVALVDQAARLLQAVSPMAQADSRTAVVSIERTDPYRLKEAIEAYRGQNGSDNRLSPAGSNRTNQPSPNHSSQVLAPGSGLALVNYLFQDQNAEASTADSNDSAATAPAAATTPGGLDVDVEVETLPDLDVIILRGRNRDVRKLTEIIQELERLSRETQPAIRIVQLQHAQSEAIATIVEGVQEDLTGRRQGRVSVTPLVKPNALLLIGWGDAIESVVELIQKLDTPVAPETQFQVFRLRSANATIAQTAVAQFFANRTGLGPKVQALADVQSNSLIVYASPRDMQEVQRLVESIDSPASDMVNRAEVVPLKNSLATDLAATLQTAIQSTDGAGQPTGVLELLTVDAAGEQLIRSGILSRVKITANARNNSLIISGPKETVPMIRALINELDSPGAVAQIKVFRILNGDATSLVQMLRSLLPTQTGANIGPQLPTADGDTSLAPLRFAVDNRTNSIIATGGAGDLEIVQALLLRLDEKDIAERRNEVYRLKNAPAIDVAAAINEFLRSERIVSQAAPGVQNPFEQIEKEVVVVPEPVRNTLIISATPRYFDEIERLVQELDQEPPQVMIQVLIAEITLGSQTEFGVELGLQDSVLFDRSLLGELVTTTTTDQTSTAAGIVTSTQQIIQAATNEPGFNFNNQPLGNSGSTKALQNSDRVGSQGLSSFAVGRVNSELGFGGLVLSASSDSVSVLLRALQESRRLDVLSRPQIRTLDNQTAFIQVGQRVPRIVQSNVTDGGRQTNEVALENVGLILGVTPRISPAGTVVMEIDAEKSSLGPEAEGIPVSFAPDGSAIRSPRIDTTTAQATVSASSGETIILGGLITKETQAITRRVPYLSDIPLLGNAFRFDSSAHRRKELLIVLTPHVIRSPEDSERINQIEMARMSWCAADVFEVHGDMGLSSQMTMFDESAPAVIYPHENPRGVPSPVEAPGLDAMPPGEYEIPSPVPSPTPFGSLNGPRGDGVDGRQADSRQVRADAIQDERIAPTRYATEYQPTNTRTNRYGQTPIDYTQYIVPSANSQQTATIGRRADTSR